RSFRADELHALVDLERRLVRQAPDVFQHPGGAAVEAVHRPTEVGILEAAHVYRLGVGADHPGAGVPEHQVRVVDAVADDRSDLVQHGFGDPCRDVPPGIHGNDLADLARGDL